jgi:hypothetical protein
VATGTWPEDLLEARIRDRLDGMGTARPPATAASGSTERRRGGPVSGRRPPLVERYDFDDASGVA